MSPFWTIPMFGVAGVYLVGVWASVSHVWNRKRALRNILSLTLVLLVLATVFTGDPALAVLLLVPSSLLAIAAGIIFQGPQRPS